VRKAVTIIVVVAGYCVLEIVALFCNLLACFASRDPGFEPVFFLDVQFLLIPGAAVLFSRLLYGSASWKKRVLSNLMLVAGSALALFELLFVTAILADHQQAPALVFSFIFLPAFVGICSALFFLNRRVRKQTLQLESARWLAERQSGISARERKWKSQAIGWSLWIPICTVLLVVVYLPETWGVVSHLFQPSMQLGRYKVPIPITWVALEHRTRTEDSWVYGVAGRTTGLRQYALGSFPLSSWHVEIRSTKSWSPQDDEIIARRKLTIGGASRTCVEYWPSYLKPQEQSQEKSVAYVTCSLPDRLYASFSGERAELQVFFRMLEGIKGEKSR